MNNLYPAHAAGIIHDHRNGYHCQPNPVCPLCSPTHKFVLYDSDGNEIETLRSTRAKDIGAAVLRHFALVDSTPGADEPYLTITRELALD